MGVDLVAGRTLVGKTLNVGMLGCGHVGTEVARLLVANATDLAARAGVPLILTKIAVRDLSIDRPGIPKELFTTDVDSIVNDPSIDLVIEVMGGIEPAHELILTAMKNGKAVLPPTRRSLPITVPSSSTHPMRPMSISITKQQLPVLFLFFVRLLNHWLVTTSSASWESSMERRISF